MIQFPFIGAMLLATGIGAAAVAVVGERHATRAGLTFSGIALLLAMSLLFQSVQNGAVNASEQYSYYVQSFNVLLSFYLTPISLILLLMATIVAFVTILSGNVEHEHEKLATFLIMLFEFSAIGLFASANLFLFFIFWDIGVIALFFMLYMLGSVNRRKAAMKFIVYEIMASLFLLFAIMLIWAYTPSHTLDIQYLIQNGAILPAKIQSLVFIFMFIAFLTNMPVFPLHLWLPDAHTEASTQGSMLLSGVLTKFGGYGMLLLFFTMPIASSYAVYVALLAGISAVLISFVLMTQHDIKRVVAYTTIVEMSIILIGISSLNAFGTYGAAYAMLAHGFIVSMLFLTAGGIGHMFGTRDYRMLKGLISGALSTSYTFLAGIFATTGLPLTAAFIGDILIFIGAIKTFTVLGALPLLSLVLLGAFLYYIINKSFLSTTDHTDNLSYIGHAQNIGYAVLLFSILFFGVFPFVVTNLFPGV